MKKLINLQLFGEGGGGASAGAGATGAGEGGAAEGVGATPAQSDDLSQIVYGKSNVAVTQPTGETTKSPEDRAKAFDEMIKKGGEYAEEFNKRTQSIIDKRFKQTKGLEEQLKTHEGIMSTLAAKYGVDASDIEGISKALESDNSMFEEQAFKEGLTVEQYRHKLELERENARLKAAESEQAQREHSEQIYAGWLKESEALKQKYGIENFDLAEECNNEDFTRLLSSGATLEGAYMAVHFDDVLNGAMAKTASNVEQAIVNNITARSSRPAENGTQSSASQGILKPDPSKWSDEDLAEVSRRVARGEIISL